MGKVIERRACEDCGEEAPRGKNRRMCERCGLKVCPYCFHHVHAMHIARDKALAEKAGA